MSSFAMVWHYLAAIRRLSRCLNNIDIALSDEIQSPFELSVDFSDVSEGTGAQPIRPDERGVSGGLTVADSD